MSFLFFCYTFYTNFLCIILIFLSVARYNNYLNTSCRILSISFLKNFKVFFKSFFTLFFTLFCSVFYYINISYSKSQPNFICKFSISRSVPLRFSFETLRTVPLCSCFETLMTIPIVSNFNKN